MSPTQTIIQPLPSFNEKAARKGIPEQMQHAMVHRWIIYELSPSPDGGKTKKFPRSVCTIGKTNRYKTWNDKSGWVNFDAVCEHIKDTKPIKDTTKFHPGFVIGSGFDLIFIDLDECFDSEGKLTPTAFKYYNSLKRDAFVEVSISGRGLHIFTWYTGERIFPNHPEEGVEVYQDGRGALITGILYGGDE